MAGPRTSVALLGSSLLFAAVAVLLGMSGCPFHRGSVAAAAVSLPAQTTARPKPTNILVPGADPTGDWQAMLDELWAPLTRDSLDLCQDGGACPCRTGCNAALQAADKDCCVRFSSRSTPPATVICGNIARAWFRMMFHDAGTFDKTDGSGGMDGSLQYELDRPENQFKGSINAYKTAIANHPGAKASMADTIVLAAYMGLYACGGPELPFVPSRVDAPVANGAGLLPARTETTESLLATMKRMSFNEKDIVTIIGAGHTIAGLAGEQLDSTPQLFDNKYFQDLLAGRKQMMASDVAMLGDKQMRMWVERFAQDNKFWMTAIKDSFYKMSYLGQPSYILPKSDAGMVVDSAAEKKVKDGRARTWAAEPKRSDSEL